MVLNGDFWVFVTLRGPASGLIGRFFGDVEEGGLGVVELTEEGDLGLKLGADDSGLTDWGTGEGVESELSVDPQLL